MMNKNEIKKMSKDFAKYYNYTVITKSFYIDGQTVFFNAFDNSGNCFEFYIDFETGYGTKQILSGIMVHEPFEITNMLNTYLKYNF